jgi:CO dehydrogenase maturation factor
VLIDSPAGLEHLNRRVTAHVDDIFDIIGPSSKSFAHVLRADRVIRETGISANHFYVVGGYQFPTSEEQRVASVLSQEYLGNVAMDPLLQRFVLTGRSLLELPPDSLAVQSVTQILQKAGY